MHTDPDRTPPAPGELKAALERYFFGPFDDAQIAKLVERIAAEMNDLPLYRGICSSFHPGNGGVGFGLAWREELAFGHLSPSALETSIWIAWASGLRPRNHCPPALVGEWEQIEPVVTPTRPRWVFSADGSFRTDVPELRAREEWCVHRQGEHGPAGDVMWLRYHGDRRGKYVHIDAVADHELRLFNLGGLYEDTLYRLRRVPQTTSHPDQERLP